MAVSPIGLEVPLGALRRERPPVMLLGGLSLVRSLGLASVPTILATSDLSEVASRSRYVTGICRLPASEPGDRAVIDALLAAGQWLHDALGRKVPLFYANDDHLSLIYCHRQELARHYLLALNEPSLAMALLEKDRFEALSRHCDLPVPRSWEWTGEVEGALENASGPKLVKPLKKTGWRDAAVRRRLVGVGGKALVFEDGRALTAQLRLSGVSDELSIQDYIPGDDRHLYSFHGFADGQSRVLAWFVGRKVRTWPALTGESSFVELVREEALARLGHELTARLGLKGVFKMDFKQHAGDGRFYLLEINARFSLWTYLGAVNGLNLAKVAYDYLVDGRVDAPATYGTRYKWVKLPLDYKAFRELRGKGELGWGRWLASVLLTPTVHHRFSWRDPTPLWSDWTNRASRRLRRWHSTAS